MTFLNILMANAFMFCYSMIKSSHTIVLIAIYLSIKIRFK